MSAVAPSQPPIPAPDPGWIPSPLYRMTVEEYEAMVESGALESRNRFHLINGYLVAKMTQNPPHAVADEALGAALVRILPADRYHGRAAKPVQLLGRDSEPEPDRCIARGTPFDYADHHPGPGEVAIIMEIADSSLAADRTLATEVYGPAGIPVYWIVNLIHRQVEVYAEPSPLGYRSTEVVVEGQSVPVVIDGQPVGWIAVSDILPPRPTAPQPGT
jgi:Uma2 family endonuclease